MCEALSTRAVMTLPSVRRLWFIIPASLALLFSAPDRPMFSDPAKSTRLSLPTLRRSSPATLGSLTCTVMANTECERLEWSLNFVAAICLRVLPFVNSARAAWESLTVTSSKPWIRTPRLLESSKILSPLSVALPESLPTIPMGCVVPKGAEKSFARRSRNSSL